MAVARRRSSKRHESAVGIAFIYQLMAIGLSFDECSQVASVQQRSPVVFHEHGLPGQHHDKFILVLMPMPLGRRGPGLQHDVTDAKIGKAHRRRDPPHPSLLDKGGMISRIACAIALDDILQIDAGHGVLLSVRLAKGRGIR
jgi:hypothetical protein|tara:strand:- start:3423 stop:3848 length:426 start_codon:yes stop_codon:yes gene_type:complete